MSKTSIVATLAALGAGLTGLTAAAPAPESATGTATGTALVEADSGPVGAASDRSWSGVVRYLDHDDTRVTGFQPQGPEGRHVTEGLLVEAEYTARTDCAGLIDGVPASLDCGELLDAAAAGDVNALRVELGADGGLTSIEETAAG